MAREEQKMRSEGVRQAILDTAYEIGIKEGFEELSIRKIINQMKYSTGVVYHHFKDKQEIIDAIEEAEAKWLHDQIIELLDDTNDVVMEIEMVFHRILELAYKEPEKYNLIVLHKYSRRKAEQPGWITHLGRRLQDGINKGIIKEMDAEKAAFAIWSSFLGFHLMISRYTDLELDQAEEMFRIQLNIILKGVMK